MLRGLLHEGPREGGAQSCREGLCASETERQRHGDKENEQTDSGREPRHRELKAPCPRLLHGDKCRGWRVLRAHQGLPRVDVGRGWAPGLWVLGRQALGGSGVFCTGGQRWVSSPTPAACLFLPPRGKHRDIHGFPEGPVGQPEWLLKLASPTRSGYFRRFHPWLSPRQGGYREGPPHSRDPG